MSSVIQKSEQLRKMLDSNDLINQRKETVQLKLIKTEINNQNKSATSYNFMPKSPQLKMNQSQIKIPSLHMRTQSDQVFNIGKTSTYVQQTFNIDSNSQQNIKNKDAYEVSEYFDIIKKNQQLHNHQENIIQKVLEMVSSFEGYMHAQSDLEIQKVCESIKYLMQQLQTASKTEIELTLKQSEIVQLKQQQIQQKQQYEILQKNYQGLQQENQKLDKIRKQQLRDLLDNQKNINQQKKTNQEGKKKIGSLEKRLEFVVESDYANFIDGHYQRVLTELVQENEKLQKSLEKQEKLNKGYQETIQKQNLKLNRITQKLEIMKRKISLKDLESVNEEQIQEMKKIDPNQQIQIQNDNPVMIMLKLEIPRSLDFRLNALKSQQQAYILNEITEQGSQVFTQQVLKNPNLKQQQDSVMLVAQQFLSFKEIGDKLTQIQKNLITLNQMNDIENVMNFVQNNFNHIFQAQRVFLWIADKQMGVLYTTKQDDITKQYRALIGKGVFGEVFRHQKAVNKKDREDIVLFFRTDQPGKDAQVQRVDSVICMPIFKKDNTVCGVLEVSNSKNNNFGFDEELYAVILCRFLNTLIDRLVDIRSLRTQLKYKDYFYEAFCEFIESRDKLQLYQKVREWVKTIFAVDNLAFYILEEKGLLKYDENKQPIYFSIEQGLAGSSVKNNKVQIIENMKSSTSYDSNIDVNSILPVQIVPLRMKSQKLDSDDSQEVIGVIEIIVKKKFQIRIEQDQLLLGSTPLIGIDESFESCFGVFCKLLSQAIILIKDKEKYQNIEQNSSSINNNSQNMNKSSLLNQKK